MTAKNSKSIPGIAHGLLGKLGFRWIFPIGTLPVPFHRLFVPLALAGIIGWTLSSALHAFAGSGGSASWLTMLLAGLGLGVLMSVPVLCWFVFTLGGRLLQSVLFLASMVLLAIECWQGQAQAIWAALPATYFGLFAVQLTFGGLWLRKLLRENEAFVPQGAGQNVAMLSEFSHFARDLIAGSAIASLYCPPLRGTIKAKHFHWLTVEDARALQDACGDDPPKDWRFEPTDGAVLLVREGAAKPKKAIVLHQGKLRTPLWLVSELKQISAIGSGQRWRLLYGEAGTIAPVPLASLFRFTSISGSSYNHLFAGFPRRKAASLTKPEVLNGREFSLLFEPRTESGPYDKGGLAALHAEIALSQRAGAERRAKIVANIDPFWARLAMGERLSLLDRQSFETLCKEPTRLVPDNLPTVLDWLEGSRNRRDTLQLRGAARLLEAFPLDQLRTQTAWLEAIFNSQSLALQWDIARVVDRAPLPRELPLLGGALGGFGLFLSNHSLYRKLALVSPQLGRIERALQTRLEGLEPGLRTTARIGTAHGWVSVGSALDRD